MSTRLQSRRLRRQVAELRARGLAQAEVALLLRVGCGLVHYHEKPLAPCRHCGAPGRRPRGLCAKCYDDKSIRRQYPSVSPHAHPKARGEECAPDRPAGVPRPLPARPTRHLPGSEGKVEEMCRRALAGEALWHPGDARAVA